MDRETVEKRVKQIMMEHFGMSADKITPGSFDSFIKDFGADSFDLVELLLEAEEQFGVQISDEEAEKIHTVRDAIDYLADR